jgi:hypothetical protein
MTGKTDAPFSPVQPPVQHRPAPSGCIVGQERGQQCFPVVPGSLYCDNHDPQRRESRQAITRRAARASHERRKDPELEAWASTIDFSSEEKRQQALRETAARVVTGKLAPAEGHVVAALARAAVSKPAKTTLAPRVLHVVTRGPEAS